MLIRGAKSALGFTMIELVVTMSIFAILVAIGIPTMRTWVSNNRVRGMTDSLQNGLRVAQAESLRRSRQVVFSLTNSTTPSTIPVAAVANGTSWAIYTIPSMTDGSEPAAFIQSGVISNASSSVTMNSNGTAALCFNSVGRLIANATTGVTAITGGATCSQPTTGTPPVQKFNITAPGADRNLQVNVGLGGQVHMCDPHITLSSTNPEGC